MCAHLLIDNTAHTNKSKTQECALEYQKAVTLAPYSSGERQEPIFNNAVNAGAVAEPNSNADASNGSS